jgi:hypothetical protein
VNTAPTARTAHDFFEMNNMNFLLVACFRIQNE